MRDVEMITPKAIAAVYASVRHAGGASAAGAIVQKAADASPDTNEQFFSHGASRIPPSDKMLIATKLFQVARPRPSPVVLECHVYKKTGTERQGGAFRQAART